MEPKRLSMEKDSGTPRQRNKERWARRDLNSRPTGYQPVAPTDLSYGPRC